jgi:hypothetical protein
LADERELTQRRSAGVQLYSSAAPAQQQVLQPARRALSARAVGTTTHGLV